ncbi:hypothetical protein M433DRAFT_147180 [Acidomyces richmondensis BFW]|nr:hypothetical protein M433DRAFT_147180 [Acidomyces richmondensis BFW]
MDRASQILAQCLPGSYAAGAEQGEVARSTLHARAHGRRPRKEKDQDQQYLSPRHPEIKARRVRALDWDRHPNNIYDKMVEWFEIIGDVLQAPDVRRKNVWNMDETGVMLSKLCSVKGARVKRTTVTAIERISADGEYLTPMVIWPASTHRSNWTTYPTPGWHYACSESGYTDSKISLEWLKRVFDPQTKEQAQGEKRVLICDGFGTHETVEILEFCFDNNILLCRLPSHISHKLQPCDISVFAPLKSAYRDQIGKEHFTALYAPARSRAFTKKNILAGWARSGLFPFNPDRVLRDAPKPALLTRPQVREVDTSPCPQCEVIQSPVMPVTPVGAEALSKMQALIRRDAQTLDDGRSKWRLQWYTEKLLNAAKRYQAERALHQDQIQFLFKVNNEAKVRQSTKSLVLEKAKVMLWEDIVAAREKRAGKRREEVTADKPKRGRKRKNPESEGEEVARKAKRGREPQNPAA